VANQQSLSGLSKFGDLKKRLVFLLGALVVFRIGAHIPVPGVDAVALAKLYEGAANGIFGMLNMFSGGSLERFSIFAIGIMPYISASIIIQLLASVHPALAELRKEGESGRRKISKYTRYSTVVLATLQAVGISTGLPNMLPGLVPNLGFSFYFFNIFHRRYRILYFFGHGIFHLRRRGTRVNCLHSDGVGLHFWDKLIAKKAVRENPSQGKDNKENEDDTRTLYGYFR